MIHLAQNIWLDADKYGYSFCTKGLVKTGKKKGEVKYHPFSHHSTEEQVSKKIVDLGIREVINGDLAEAYRFFNEAHKNFVDGIGKLKNKRYL